MVCNNQSLKEKCCIEKIHELAMEFINVYGGDGSL